MISASHLAFFPSSPSKKERAAPIAELCDEHRLIDSIRLDSALLSLREG